MNQNITEIYVDRLYQNNGNPELLAHVHCNAERLLDVGCGAGDNARRLLEFNKSLQVFGITASQKEAEQARKYMQQCLISDIETEVPSEYKINSFDCILFSHVLEHLRDPSKVIATFVPYLKDGGQILIAVPNIANYRSRWQLIRGMFEYQASGVFDETHLRFYTYYSAEKFLLRDVNELELLKKEVTGSVPLWLLRRHIFSSSLSQYLDRIGCKLLPNLFGGQIILNLVKRSTR